MKYIFLDRDETLNYDPGYINNPKLIKLKPNVIKGLQLLAQFNYKFIILTNQSGINRGKITPKQLKAVHQKLLSLLKKENIEIEKIYFCPHTDEDNCKCRKPKDGLLKKAIKNEKRKGNKISFEQSYLIGDRERDISIGKKHNIKGILLATRNLATIEKVQKIENCFKISSDMLEAASFVLENNFNQQVLQKINNSSLIKKWKAKKQKIVFTNGCFDILHPGHIQYLKQASQLGKKLIIGLNSDAGVASLKGKHRPINNFQHRAMMLATLDFIDLVIEFNQATPTKLISQIKPNIHIKGGDYKAKELPEYRVINEYGGKVIILPFRKGFSTSKIVKKINMKN